MSKAVRKILLCLVALLLVLRAEEALSGCTLSVTNCVFGNYDVFSNLPRDTAATVTVNCTYDVVWAFLRLGPSAVSGTFDPRQMRRAGGTDLLNYNLFTDVTRTVIFGNGSSRTSVIRVKRPVGRPAPWVRTENFYGRLPPSQDVAIGDYSDILTLTIEP